MSDELLLTSVEEAHCLLSALHQTLSNLIPVHLRGLFEDKCIEVGATAVSSIFLWTIFEIWIINTLFWVLLASPTRPPPLSFNPGSPYRVSTRGGRGPPTTYAQPNYGDRAACGGYTPPASARRMADACTQTFSTGDIQVLNVFYEWSIVVLLTSEYSQNRVIFSWM